MGRCGRCLMRNRRRRGTSRRRPGTCRARAGERDGHVSREAGAAGGGADVGGESSRVRWCGRRAEALALVRATAGGAPQT
eukprot:6719041-Prymnesium_polylepis.1